MKKYEDLTPKERKDICNGCGGKGGCVVPPHAIFFMTSCDHHDYGYWKGCTEEDRLICDKNLKIAMVKDCSNLNWHEYLRYRPWCELYYMAVRLCGKKYFYYADKQRELK